MDRRYQQIEQRTLVVNNIRKRKFIVEELSDKSGEEIQPSDPTELIVLKQNLLG